MGFSSWCYCDTGSIRKGKDGILRPSRAQRLMIASKDHPASVLFPKEFGGKSAQVDAASYDGYERIGGVDVCELVADWNRKELSKKPDFIIAGGEKIEEQAWYAFYADLSLSRKALAEKLAALWNTYDGEHYRAKGDRIYMGSYIVWEYRYIGIAISIDDKCNASLPYPVKIARFPASVYEECPPSPKDPLQGCD